MHYFPLTTDVTESTKRDLYFTVTLVCWTMNIVLKPISTCSAHCTGSGPILTSLRAGCKINGVYSCNTTNCAKTMVCSEIIMQIRWSAVLQSTLWKISHFLQHSTQIKVFLGKKACLTRSSSLWGTKPSRAGPLALSKRAMW